MRYIRPHLEFSSIALSPWLQKDIDMLERVQKRAVNMVNGLKSNVYKEKLHELGMETLADRRIEADLTMMYKILNGKCSVTREIWADLTARTVYVTRAAGDDMNIKKPFARTEKRANFYTVWIADMWNALPKNIRTSKMWHCLKVVTGTTRIATVEGQEQLEAPINQAQDKELPSSSQGSGWKKYPNTKLNQNLGDNARFRVRNWPDLDQI
jgi:hypothetical protein